jgi:hypothetical protein
LLKLKGLDVVRIANHQFHVRHPCDAVTRAFRLSSNTIRHHPFSRNRLHRGNLKCNPKARDNIAAIRLLKTLEAENREATGDEKALLARYVGSRLGDWQVCWLGGWTRHRLSYLVMVVKINR